MLLQSYMTIIIYYWFTCLGKIVCEVTVWTSPANAHLSTQPAWINILCFTNHILAESTVSHFALFNSLTQQSHVSRLSLSGALFSLITGNMRDFGYIYVLTKANEHVILLYCADIGFHNIKDQVTLLIITNATVTWASSCDELLYHFCS